MISCLEIARVPEKAQAGDGDRDFVVKEFGAIKGGMQTPARLAEYLVEKLAEYQSGQGSQAVHPDPGGHTQIHRERN